MKNERELLEIPKKTFEFLEKKFNGERLTITDPGDDRVRIIRIIVGKKEFFARLKDSQGGYACEIFMGLFMRKAFVTLGSYKYESRDSGDPSNGVRISFSHDFSILFSDENIVLGGDFSLISEISNFLTKKET